jgi:hypothetical protein
MKKMVTIVILASLVLIGCFSPWKGNEASIILNIGGSIGNRSVWPHEEDPSILDEIVYKVIIDGQDYKKFESIGGKTIKTTITPGIYTITIEAWYLNKHYAKGSLENITINVGVNTIPFPLTAWIPDMEPNKTYLIAEGINKEFDSFLDAYTEARDNLQLEVFTISISDMDHFLNSDTVGTIDANMVITIKNHGSGTAYIKPDIETNGSIFSVYGNLILQGNITLEGVDDNYSALINVYGTLNMNGNVKITRNNNIEGYGGGVCVFEGGTFNMEAGTISNNKALYRGGGVCVADGGKFHMSGGIISGNEVSSSMSNTASGGGGVFIEKGAFFDKTKGTIYGGGENAGVDDQSLCNKDSVNGAHSVYLGNIGKYENTTVWEELNDVP